MRSDDVFETYVERGRSDGLSEQERAVVEGGRRMDGDSWNNYAREERRRKNDVCRREKSFGVESDHESDGDFGHRSFGGKIDSIEIDNRTLSQLTRIARRQRRSLYDVCREALRKYVAADFEAASEEEFETRSRQHGKRPRQSRSVTHP